MCLYLSCHHLTLALVNCAVNTVYKTHEELCMLFVILEFVLQPQRPDFR